VLVGLRRRAPLLQREAELHCDWLLLGGGAALHVIHPALPFRVPAGRPSPSGSLQAGPPPAGTAVTALSM